MSWQIVIVFVLLLGALVSFVWEKIPPDLTGMTVFVALMATGIIDSKQAFSVFSNPAPITVAAMFVLSAALAKCGAIDRLSAVFDRMAGLPYPVVLFVVCAVVATVSAFINNTPVVVIFLPVVLNIARRMQLAPSKFLIPLSYAAVLGGTCTLIGTSTNLVVNGVATRLDQPPFRLWEIAWLGVPATLIGLVYVALAGKHLLPNREMLTSILSAEERREYITEAFVQPTSPAVGKTLSEAGLSRSRGVRVLEIVRDGVALYLDPERVRLRAGDRIILACRPRGIVATRALAGVDLAEELKLGLEQIAAHEGAIVEAVITPSSDLVGHTVREVNFRQRYRMVVLAVHRRGRNVREQLDTLPLASGDVLLMMGTDQAINALRTGEDLILFDQPPLPAKGRSRHTPLVLAVIAAAVLGEAFGLVRIEVGALCAAVLLCITGAIRPKEAYDAIEWNILFLIFSMLAVGLALESTGAVKLLAERTVHLCQLVAPQQHQPMLMLAAVYLVTTTLTEILSNNAVAALMTPLAIGIAGQLGVEARPFLVAVMFAASAAFATPIGYQTNTYVYGIGGYRFGDFVKFGIPMNIVCFIVAMLVIPRVWSF